MFSVLKKWLGRSLRQRPDLHFLMYTRQHCPLCDDAWTLLRTHQKERGFTLDKLDVDAARELTDKYGEHVPVIMVNGQERFRGRVNPVLLRRLLDANPQAAG